MIETIIVLAIVAIAVFILGRKVYFAFNSKGECCGCTSCSSDAPRESKDVDRDFT